MADATPPGTQLRTVSSEPQLGAARHRDAGISERGSSWSTDDAWNRVGTPLGRFVVVVGYPRPSMGKPGTDDFVGGIRLAGVTRTAARPQRSRGCTLDTAGGTIARPSAAISAGRPATGSPHPWSSVQGPVPQEHRPRRVSHKRDLRIVEPSGTSQVGDLGLSGTGKAGREVCRRTAEPYPGIGRVMFLSCCSPAFSRVTSSLPSAPPARDQRRRLAC
jgi:hypothetical protein